MKILIYTPVFYPMIGGMETVAECLAGHLVKEGHECIVVTPIEHSLEDHYSFKVYRNPGLAEKIRLIRWADMVFSNGASLAIFPWTKLLGKPFAWKHAGYQASCVDGLGWVDGKPAPVRPLASIRFHFRRKGFFYACKEAVKLSIRRLAAKYMVDMNVAITNWVASKQPFKKQTVIYNPSPLNNFVRPSEHVRLKFDFVYMGRLVSEKGVKTLIQALSIVQREELFKDSRLLIIGDGPIRKELEELARAYKLEKHIEFVGRRKGQELTDMIHSSKIAVVPSEWEEPMGIVALELMAAGRNIIISEKGGLKECVGDAGLSFPNGDAQSLAECMVRLLTDKQLAEDQKYKAMRQLEKFDPTLITRKYITLFESLIKRK